MTVESKDDPALEAQEGQEDNPDSGRIEDPEGLEKLLDYLKNHRAFDFSGYKRASLSRRILQRMQAVDIPSFTAYVDHLEVHPEEFPQLFNTVLINVTSFFRDPASWAALIEQIRRIVATKSRTEPVRVWTAGCSSGEEPFTMAMVLAEVMGVDEVNRRVKIYATDIDEEALATARAAVYPARALENVPAEYVAKYFTQTGGGFAFTKDLRRDVIFGRHDLLQDAPISRIDILSCRNTLMYFNAETQARALQSLHYALQPEGVFFLGKAEMLLTHGNLFAPIDLKQRLFQPVRRTDARIPILAAEPPPDERTDADRQRVLRAAIDAAPVALVVVDADGRVSLVNGHAATLFGLRDEDVGRAFHDLELSYRPAELRSCIDSARKEARAHALRGVEWLLPGAEKAFLDIDVCPLFGEGGQLLGVELAFTDITLAQRLKGEVQRAHVELAAAHEELQSTNEELETTNEELQSTVEELETTNEELQSTNEELETINEELQSTNEEMITVNDEMRQRSAELSMANGFLAAILASMGAGVVVLDEHMRVKAWNERMEDLWGLRREEVVDTSFFGLDIGLPLEPLRAAIRESLHGEGPRKLAVDGTNRRGKAVHCLVSISALRAGPRGVMIMIDEGDGK